jgi:DnaJ-class molecular chaperone
VLHPDEAAAGTVLSLDVPVTATCEACSGTGGPLFDCERCDGEGRVIRRLPVPVHVPPGLREGSVFQVRTDLPSVPNVLLTVHLRRI